MLIYKCILNAMLANKRKRNIKKFVFETKYDFFSFVFSFLVDRADDLIIFHTIRAKTQSSPK